MFASQAALKKKGKSVTQMKTACIRFSLEGRKQRQQEIVYVVLMDILTVNFRLRQMKLKN